MKLTRLPSVPTVGKNSKSQNGSPVLSPVLPSSSLRNITQCWLSVVQEQVGRSKSVRRDGTWCPSFMSHLPLSLQVSRFLAAAWRASDFVPRYCSLYERLQRAGLELFGPRAAFTVALRSGFSGALLQQSFLTATHVSPAQYQAWAATLSLSSTLLPLCPLARGLSDAHSVVPR